MCVNVEVILPIVEKFLLAYPLRCGTILIFIWTLFRTIFCIVFITTAILEILIGEKFPLGAWLVKRKPAANHVYLLYYTQVTLLLCEGVLLVFLVHLAIGISRRVPRLLNHYLICRFFTWLTEVACLLALCFLNELLIGWYLGIMFFVVLELYSFIVVYSYYVKLQESEKIFME
ncbi:uncharacterized protein LOC123872943 isoform X2 [Maniola jurtina]|uniref:uncharacterized protein LOC123872943 isoform X2 n=1 Tax=Maniola jurtina TaxID=191418 RepID=UPI001E68B22E|nr:uncharacterized protein LOC123872943 isoform X2 [Maniola jurtina]